MKIPFTARSFATCAVIALCAALAACGGGGKSGYGGTLANVQQLFTVPIDSTVPNPSTYAGEELAAYNVFNTARSQCGFGYLRQNSSLVTAAYNHIVYEAANSATLGSGHVEQQGASGFTGTMPSERMVAAGYTNLIYSGEVLTAKYAGQAANTGFGSALSRTLLSAPYHLINLMQGYREIGISLKMVGPASANPDIVQPSLGAPGSTAWLVADMGASLNAPIQAQSPSTILTYPCDGVTGTAYLLQTETPNPVPGRNLQYQPVGQPVLIQLLAGRTLAINGATMTGPNGSVPLLAPLTAANDPNGELKPSQAILIPSSPLSPSTTYAVSVSGSNNGDAFSRNFSFTTGN